MTVSDSNSSDLLAIVAMGCRYPGGVTDTASLWDRLTRGVDTVCEVPPDRWDLRKYYDPRPKTPGKMYIREGAFLTEDIWQFDPNYFGIGPLEAERLDPQQRLLLKVTLEALENGNITKRELARAKTGVYVGCFSTDNVVDASSTESKLRMVATQSPTCGVVTMLSARLSYYFGLNGACLSVDTACSSSLVAFHLACQAIRAGEVDQALVGGVNVIFRPEFTTTMCFGGFLAKDGRSKTFSARGDGYGRGEGAGVVLVKPYEQAVADGNEIFAVVCGTGVNQDGRTNGITVPNEHSQLDLMRTVARQSGVEPSWIGYAEAHGTGTAVGDPKEAYSLGHFLREGRDPNSLCYVGSVKTNIGHQEAGAGVAGIIKTALCLKHGKVVPNLHFEDPNPEIDFDALRLSVPTHIADLDADYACVNSFGFGGTNAHAILRKPPERTTQKTVSSSAKQLPQAPFLLPLSARSEASLKARAAQYANVLEHASVADLIYTVGCHRDHENVRAGVVAVSAEDAGAKLLALAEQEDEAIPDVFSGRVAADDKSDIVFLFTGMGAQSWGMGASLMEREPVFAQAIVRLDSIFTKFSPWSLTQLFSDPEHFGYASGTPMDEPQYAQPGNVAIQLALADVWRAKGLEPGCIIGHSVGEIAAACVAGSLSEEDALVISFHRGKLHQRLSGRGGMLAVGTTAEKIAPLLSGKAVSIAAVNSPSALTLSGDDRELDELAAHLEKESVFARRLQVKVPYHSVLMEETRDDFFALLNHIKPQAAKIPLYSTLTGQKIIGEELNCDYWWQNSREAVLFYPAINLAFDAGYRSFLEVGPHPVLRGSVLETAKAKDVHGVSCVESLNRKQDDQLTMARSLAALYANGAELDWRPAGAGGQKIPLPSYPWDEQRYAYFQDSPENERLVRGQHPLLQNKQNIPGDSWRSEINPQFFPWLDDHKIQGHTILPGATYVETMIACASEYGKADDQWAVRDVHISSIQPTSEIVDFAIDINEDDEITIHGRGVSQDVWEPRATGRLVRSPLQPHFPAIDLQKAIKDCQIYDQDIIYETALKNGYGFGPKFQVVKQFFIRDNVILSRVDAAHLSDEIDSYYIHPVVLDGIFQILNGIYVADMPAARHGQYLPSGVKEVRLFERGIKECWVRCELSSDAGNSVDLNMSVHDLNGAVIGEIRGYRSIVVATGEAAGKENMRDKLYTINWEAHPWPDISDDAAAAPDRKWLVFADEQGRSTPWIDTSHQYLVESELWDSPSKLRARLDEILSTEKIEGVIYGWSLDENLALHGQPDIDTGIQNTALVLEILHALPAHPQAEFQKLVVLTDGAVPNEKGVCVRPGQAPMIGLCRTAKIEHPELGVTLVDLNHTALEPHQRHFLLSAAFQDHEVMCGADAYRVSRVTALKDSPVRLLPAPNVGDFSLKSSDRGGTASLRFVERERKALADDDVEIEVRAAGLNFKDLMKVLGLLDADYIAGTYFGNTLGMECTGVISRVGAAITHLKPGDAVVAGTADTFAKYVVMPGQYVFKKPSTLSFAEAVIPFINTMPAYYGLIEKANLKRGDKVLIHSASGGVGLAALQIAQMTGAEIFATAGSEKKRQYLRDRGVSFVSDSRSLRFFDDIMEWTNGKGVDVVLNFLPGEALEKSVELLAFGGRFIELGKIDILSHNNLDLGLFKKNISFTHIDFDNIPTQFPEECIRMMNHILGMYERKELLPINTTTYPARAVKDAFDFMKTSEHIGKIVLDMSDHDGLEIVPTGHALRVRTDGVYLITGGFSALGLKGAQWLGDHGARHIGLIGRSGAKSDQDKAFVSKLTEQGVEVLELRADISQPEEVKSLLAGIKHPVRGVLNLATLYRDVPIAELTEDDLRLVLGVKAKGLSYFLENLDNDQLDWVVNFSSLASYGSHAQSCYAAANTYLDALAHSQTGHTRILSVNWGPILAGELERKVGLVRYFEDSGVIPTPANDIFPMLEQIAKTPFNQVGASDIAWDRFVKNSALSKSQLFANQTVALQQGGGGSILDHLREANTEQQREIAEDFISRHMSDVLRIPRENITPDTRMDELGVDSLIAVTLSHAIDVDSSVDLGTVAFLQKPTVRKLASEWMAKILTQQPAEKGKSRVSDGDWVQLSAPVAPKARLVCFPGAGMSVYGYKDLANALPDAEVFGMRYPSSAERPDDAAESIEAVGQEMAAAIAKLPPTAAPLAILGHSLGALFAYETAYALQKAGTPAAELILAAPGLPHAPDILTEEEGKRVLASLQDVAASQPRHLAAIRRLSDRYLVRPEDRDKLSVPLTLILAKHDEYFNNDKLESWLDFAGDATRHYVDAGHLLLSHPEVAQVVQNSLG